MVLGQAGQCADLPCIADKSMPHLDIRQLTKRFGAFVALDRLDLAVEQGEFLVLLGPSGCGKTTLLRSIAGLERQDEGQIIHAGRDISQLSPAQRDYGIVFQSYALFPNLTVGANVAYGLKSRRTQRQMIDQRVEQMLAMVGLPGRESKFPAQLSGGQQQRVALARALATAPDLLLLDEPLSALDAIERVRLRSEIRNLQNRLGVTTIMVTHDQEEALSMADRIVVMDQGQIRQVGSPTGIYRHPSNEFVADFIGRINLIETFALDQKRVLYGSLPLHCPNAASTGGRVKLYIRPEDIRLHETLSHDDNTFFAHVLKVEFLGPYSLVTLRAEGGDSVPLLAQFSSNYMGSRPIQPGATLRISLPAEHLQPMPEAA
jgi:iron(III) transport system ATP-binding protein